ncbi:hypothetical protein J6590_076299 [Homalodisca vitripennis]|nr:hypothetical protein J6590_076299 [Homalodisca vitripennis]
MLGGHSLTCADIRVLAVIDIRTTTNTRLFVKLGFCCVNWSYYIKNTDQCADIRVLVVRDIRNHKHKAFCADIRVLVVIDIRTTTNTRLFVKLGFCCVNCSYYMKNTGRCDRHQTVLVGRDSCVFINSRLYVKLGLCYVKIFNNENTSGPCDSIAVVAEGPEYIFLQPRENKPSIVTEQDVIHKHETSRELSHVIPAQTTVG